MFSLFLLVQLLVTAIIVVWMQETMKLTVCKIVDRDEYKEFEKLIQEDLQEVDKRLEEEEVKFLNILAELSFLFRMISVLQSNLIY